MSEYKLKRQTQKEWEKREGEKISEILFKKSTKKTDKLNRKISKVQRQERQNLKEEKKKANKRGVKEVNSTCSSVALMYVEYSKILSKPWILVKFWAAAFLKDTG